MVPNDSAGGARQARERVDADELAKMLASGRSVSLIDVRTPDEFRSGHIPGAVSVPLGVLTQIDMERCRGEIVLCCATGRRSVQARHILASMSIEAVDLAGGVKAWVASGGSLVAGLQA